MTEEQKAMRAERKAMLRELNRKDKEKCMKYSMLLETFTAEELNGIDFPYQDPEILYDRLLECEPIVSDGEWECDIVPSELTKDLLDYLEMMKKCQRVLSSRLRFLR